MTDSRIAALSTQELRNPEARSAAAALSLQLLQQLQPIIPADLLNAATSAQLLDQLAAPTAQLLGMSAQALVPLPPTLPDNGMAFQWHQLDDPTNPTSWSAPVERSRALVAYTASYGRNSPTGAVPPTSLTATLAMRHTTAPEIGELFRIAVGGHLTGGAQLCRIRFTGEVTDVTIDPAADNGRGTITVTAVGRLARRGAPKLDLRAAPVELDGARVVRVLDAAGVEPGSIDAGQVELQPPATELPGAQLLDEVTTSTTGLVVEQRDGTVDYHDAEHRRDAEPALALDASELLSRFTWTKRLADLVNVARITYGAEPARVVEVRDAGSVDAHNERVDDRTTALRSESDAYDLGSTIVGRRSTPAWQLPEVAADLLRTVDPAKRAKLLALSAGDRVTLSGLPAGGDYTSAELFVEGATENAQVLPGEHLTVLERTRWQLSLTVADPAMSGTTLRWRDAPPATSWDTVDPDLSWLDLARVEQPDALEPTTP